MEIAVGVLLAAAGLVLVGLVAALVARRRAAHRSAPAAVAPVDDLAEFLESPPGSAARTRRTGSDDVVALAAPPLPAAPAPPRSRRPLPVGGTAAAIGLVALLVVASAVVAVTSGRDGRRGDGERGDGERRGTDAAASDRARLRFGGIVLEERAVGVTVTFPEVVLDTGTDGPVASLELPTWNCLSAEAPEDPVEAGCAPGRTEYAELRSPDLDVTRDGDELRIAGAFPTSTRPTGSGPEATGRTYDLVVTVRPDGDAAADRRVPASGELELGERRTPVAEGELRVHD